MLIVGEYHGMVGGGDLTVRPEDIARREELQAQLESVSQVEPKFGFSLPALPEIDLSGIDWPEINLPDLPSVPSKEQVLTPIAETIFTGLDPFYGEGGILEPVTVAVDPDRTIGEEYIEPNKDVLLLGAGLLALLLLRK